MNSCADMPADQEGRKQPQTTGLSLHEIIMGRPILTGVSPLFSPHKATLLWTNEYTTNWVKRLNVTLQKYHPQVSERPPKPAEGLTYPFQCGDDVLIKSLEK